LISVKLRPLFWPAKRKRIILLIDERRGRLVASRSGLAVVGVLGVLVLAHRKGLVASVQTCIDEFRSQAGFMFRTT
jgi:predicted nucleic acid-binding protein